MQSNIYQHQNNAYYLQRDTNFHEKCQKHLYQLIQVELNDGSIYQGILHSYDHEKMYLLMVQTDHSNHSHHSHMSMHMEASSSEDRQFFPFFGPFGLFGFPFFGIRRFGPFFPFFI
ncbi:MAG TPA: hypothetical protein GXX18_14020 [Bacillales bacterium]|nr:hypothetical protein [Bacillales bacterium]